MNARLAISTIAATQLLCGCATPRPPEGPANPSCGLDRFARKDVYTDIGIYLAKASAGAIRSPLSVNLLALSAGGEFGAYGAGVLIGWDSVGAQAQPSARNDIQIVTGVSTGAILATHAFLGKDVQIEQAYLGSSGKTIYTTRPKIALLWSNSLLDATGKSELIRSYLSSDLIDAVTAAADGRGLYIGIVDADSGEFKRIDMVALARGLSPASRRDDCYRAVVNASSAIPVAFQPQFIDGHMYIDGGARRHLFLTELPAAAQASGVTRRMFAFVHGDLHVDTVKVDNHVLDVAGRLSELVTDQGMRDSIQIADFLAHEPVAPQSTGSKPEPMFLTYYAAAAAAAASCAPKKLECTAGTGLLSEDMFCQPFMACLAQEGRRDGAAYARAERPWPQWSELRRPPVTLKDAERPLRRSPIQ